MHTVAKQVSHVNENHENPNHLADINGSPLPTSTPLRAIRRFCVACVGSPYEVDGCGGDKCLNGQGDGEGVCFFYRFRMGKGRPSVKLIRKMCLECMEGSSKLVADCESDCHLKRFRFGKNPNISDETRKMRREMLLKRGWEAR